MIDDWPVPGKRVPDGRPPRTRKQATRNNAATSLMRHTATGYFPSTKIALPFMLLAGSLFSKLRKTRGGQAWGIRCGQLHIVIAGPCRK